MRKFLLSLVIMFSLVLGAVFPLLTTSTTLSAKAAAVEESTDAIDALFYAVGSELTVCDETTLEISPGAKGEYLAEFDENGKCIKSGFKLIEVGDIVGEKVVYVFKNGGYISAGFTTSGEFVYFCFNQKVYITNSSSSPHVYGEFINEDFHYQKLLIKSDTYDYSGAEVVKTIFIQDPSLTGYFEYLPAYLYFNVDKEENSEPESGVGDSSEESSEEISEEPTPGESEEEQESEEPMPGESEEQESEELKPGESEEQESENFKDTVADWMGKNLGITVTGTGALVIIAVLIFLLFKK